LSNWLKKYHLSDLLNTVLPFAPAISLVCFIAFFLCIVFQIFKPFLFPPSPSVSHRQITQKTSFLQEVWRQDIFSPGIQWGKAPLFVTNDSMVIIADYETTLLRDRLKIFDVETGQFISEIILPKNIGADSFVVRDDHLYVGANFEVQAYQLPEGQLLWQTPGKPRQRSSYELVWQDGHVVNYSSVAGKDKDYQFMSIYDPVTGGLMQQTQIPVKPMPLLTTNKTIYKGTRGRLLAIDRASGREKWQAQLNGYFQQWPTLVGSDLLVATTLGYQSISGLHLVNTATGEIKWSALEDDLVSNFAVIDNTVYAIRRNGDIVGVDINTGREVETIKFDTEETDPGKNAYWVAVSGQTLLAYYGDSWELIAFNKR
jgi:outer membrane protein assembly factor BamB